MWRDGKRGEPVGKPGASCPAATGYLFFVGRAALVALVLLAVSPGCSTTASFPPVNLTEPGWTVRSGQAVWRRKPGGAGIAGELLVATRPGGRAFVQFSKNPFPLVIAQSAPNAWAVEFPPQNERHSGHGEPPRRIIFLYLPRVLSGQPPPAHWSWQRLDDGGWRLESPSGESLDVYFAS